MDAFERRRRLGVPRRPKVGRPRAGRPRKPKAEPITARHEPLSTRVLSLDVSTKCIGWALFEGGQLLQYGKYRLSGDTHAERMGLFALWLRHHLTQLTPEDLVAEAPFFSGRGVKTYAVLATYFGVVQVAYYDHFGQPMPGENGIQPRLVKRILRVKMGEDHADRKRLMVNRINKLYGLKLRYKEQDPTKKHSDDDVADAIAVGRAWLYRAAADGGTDG